MKNKSKKRVKRVIKVLSRIAVLLILIAIIFSIVFLSGIFNIKSIDIYIDGKSVDGLGLKITEVQSLSGLYTSQNIFQKSKKEIKDAIFQNPYVKDVEVSKSFNGKVKINITERKVKYLINYAGSYIYIDGQGYILEVNQESKDLPIVLGITTDFTNLVVGEDKNLKRLNEEDLKKLNVVNSIIEVSRNNDIEALISRVDITDKNNYMVYLDSEKKIVYLGDCSDLNTRILFMKSIVKEESGIEGEIFINVDLNSEHVYFREKV